MGKLPSVKVKELVRTLERLGFFQYHQVGSHAQYKHPDGRRTTIPMHFGRDVGKGMLHSILHDIDVTDEEFIELLKN